MMSCILRVLLSLSLALVLMESQLLALERTPEITGCDDALLSLKTNREAFAENCTKVSPSGRIKAETGENETILRLVCVKSPNDMLHGPILEWYPDQNRKSCGGYKNGKLHGKWIRWFPNGNKKDEVEWKDGAPVGAFTSWTEGGSILDQGFFEKGQRVITLRHLFVTATLGASSLHYTEQSDSYDSISLIPKISFSYRPFTWLDFSGNAFLTASVISQSRSDFNMSTLGLNLRGGTPLYSSQRFRLTLSGGISYSKYTSSTGQLGFGAALFQLYPSLEFRANQTHTFLWYLKYVPALRANWLDGEVATGISWVRTLENKHKITFTLDAGRYFHEIEPGYSVSATHFSLGAGYAF